MVGKISLLLLAIIGFSGFFLAFIVYFLYFFLVYNCNNKIVRYLDKLEKIKKSDINFPAISIIVNTFNEAKIIRRKIEDISLSNYPRKKLKVIVVDDCSNDKTGLIAEKALSEFKLEGKVLRFPKRMGLNKSMNIAISNSDTKVICVTDSDVTLDKEAIRNSVMVLESFENAGGVTGKLVPMASTISEAYKSESRYRSFYDRFMLSESSCYSAFPGNGTLIIFDKSLVASSIPNDYGSTDANIAMNIIKSNKRLLYVPEAIIHERVAETFGQQKLQKVRRAKRLIQVFMHNKDVFANKKYGKFGTLIFPLKFLMVILCPIAAFTGVVSLSLFLVFSDVVLLKVGFAFCFFLSLVGMGASSKIRLIVTSFISHQVYLLLGLVSSFRKSKIWRTIDRK